MAWLIMILYGFAAALGQLLPVSGSAHDRLLGLLFSFDFHQPLMALHIHLAIFATVFFLYRHRVGHIYQQNKLRGSRRQFDTGAILDGKVVISMLVPASLGLLLSNWAPYLAGSFPRLIVLLTVSGILLYIPHFLPSGNRDSNHLSRLEAILFGFCAGLSALPGLSWMGGILAVGSLRGCSRTYLLDMALLLVLPLMLLQILLDLFAVLAVGFAGLTWVYWLQCLAAGIAAFLGASVAIGALRFLSINRGYTGFAYYNWGLAIFSFILYLMI